MPITESSAVECRALTKTYGTGPGRVPALRGVDLELRKGEMLVLIGPSGCGKTTLISILSGILDQDGGDCSVLGRDWQRMSERERVRFRGRAIGFVFQAFNLLPALTAVENIAVPLLLAGQRRAEALRRADRLLDAVGLIQRRDALPSQLSGGQQQRVAIARALIHDPALIVCDEPTSNLDTRSGREVMAMLRGLGQQPERSSIVVTHDSRVAEFADRIARMDDGKIVDVGDAREDEKPS